MSISAVIPSYNAERYLVETVHSVLAQTYCDWELLIVDDGSADRTWEIAESFSRADCRVRAIHQEHGGLAAARNRGCAEADPRHDLITFLDADDVWEPDALSLLVDTISKVPEAVAAHGLARAIDERSEPSEPGELERWGRHREGVRGRRLRPWRPSAPTTLSVLAFRNVIITPGVALIRRRVLEQVGPFDGSVNPCEDWDMWLRLSLRGMIAYLDRVVLSKRIHASNMSADRDRMIRGKVAVREKLLSLPELVGEARRTVKAAYAHQARRQWQTDLYAARMALMDGQREQLARALRFAWLDALRWARGIPTG